MKKATLALLTVTAAISVAGKANAIPFGPNNLPPGLANQGGLPPGLANQGGLSPGFVNEGGGPPGLSVQVGNNPLIVGQPVGPYSRVPEGSSLILLAAGFFALAFFGRRLQRT